MIIGTDSQPTVNSHKTQRKQKIQPVHARDEIEVVHKPLSKGKRWQQFNGRKAEGPSGHKQNRNRAAQADEPARHWAADAKPHTLRETIAVPCRLTGRRDNEQPMPSPTLWEQ